MRDSPGHILTPEPVVIDPTREDCFVEFNWRFCSPLAEKMFWDRVKNMDKDTVTELLESVFQVPSPKGILFEKVSHFLIANGVFEKFRCYAYEGGSEMNITFPECKIRNFATDTLLDTFISALNDLKDLGLKEGKSVGIALEPEDTSFDAVDIFVLVKTGSLGTPADWHLYLLQDTIARSCSLHSVKVMWYCALFCDAFEQVLPTVASKGGVLGCCEYVPVVPQGKKDFSFLKPASTSPWDEVDRVASLLKFDWPSELVGKKPDLEQIVEEKELKIPPTADGKARKLNKAVVGNALLLEHAKLKVMKQCRVIFNVVNT